MLQEAEDAGNLQKQHRQGDSQVTMGHGEGAQACMAEASDVKFPHL